MAIVVRARDMASKTVGRVRKELGSLGKVGGTAIRGLTTAMAGLAAASAVGLVAGVTAGVRSLGHLERVTNQTNAVLKSTAGVSGQTAASIRAQAEAIEQLTTADDKNVQEAQNLLLTFTKIGGKTFPRATKAAVNMAIALAKGDVANADFKGSAIQVGKALNDPIKGMTALSRAGVSFTKEQRDRVKALVEAGKVTEAQTLILKELETEFGNAGKAAGTGFEADMRRVADAGEDVSQALARGVMPALSRFAKFLSTKLADPAVQKAIQNIGDDLGDAATSAVKFIEKIDWDAVGAGLSTAKDAAKNVVGMFNDLPPWVKTAIVTGWGLNKLSGGAVSGIVTELGKGLIKGVLGMTAGVVNIKAGVVNGGGGGVPGVVPGGGGGKFNPLTLIPLVAVAAAELAVADAIAEPLRNALGVTAAKPGTAPQPSQTRTLIELGPIKLEASTVHPLQRAIAESAKQNGATISNAVIRNGFTVTDQIKTAASQEQRRGERLIQSSAQQKAAVDASKARLAAEAAATRRETTRGYMIMGSLERNTANAARQAGHQARAGGMAAAAAIRAKKLSVVVRSNIVNNLRLTVRDTQQKLTFQQNAAIYG